MRPTRYDESMRKQGYVTLANAAGQLHVGIATVRRWIGRGLLHVARNPGGLVYVRESDIAGVAQPGRSTARKPVD